MELTQNLSQKLNQAMKLNLFQTESLQLLELNTRQLLDKISALRKEFPELEWKNGQDHFIPETGEDKITIHSPRRYFPGKWIFDSKSFLSSEEMASRAEKKQQALENFSVGGEGEDLREVLWDQALSLDLSSEEREFVRLVIDNLDHRGLNRENPLLLIAGKKSRISHFRKILEQIKTFEPYGCATNNPLESLKVQAQVRFPGSSLDKILCRLSCLESLRDPEHFLDYVQNCGYKREEGLQILAQLRELEPYPARGYTLRQENIRIYPELLAAEDPNGKIYVELLNQIGASLEVGSAYWVSPKDGEERGESEKRTAKLKTLLLQLNRREETLLRLGRSVFGYQKDFITMGLKGLKILTLQMVAEDLGLHSSSVSRCIRGKYCKTPWGTYPLHFFFQRSSDGRHSREMVKEYICSILRENSEKKLSDESLKEKLNALGIYIARRTVNKYRLELQFEARIID